MDLLAAVGLGELRLEEDAFTLDFDEWFDRGAAAEPKEAVRRRLLGLSQPLASGPQASRSFSNRKRGVEIAARERCAHRADRLQP